MNGIKVGAEYSMSYARERNGPSLHITKVELALDAELLELFDQSFTFALERFDIIDSDVVSILSQSLRDGLANTSSAAYIIRQLCRLKLKPKLTCD